MANVRLNDYIVFLFVLRAILASCILTHAVHFVDGQVDFCYERVVELDVGQAGRVGGEPQRRVRAQNLLYKSVYIHSILSNEVKFSVTSCVLPS